MTPFESDSSVLSSIAAPEGTLVANCGTRPEVVRVGAVDGRECRFRLSERHRIVQYLVFAGVRHRIPHRHVAPQQTAWAITGRRVAPCRAGQRCEQRRNLRIVSRLPTQVQRVRQRVGTPIAVVHPAPALRTVSPIAIARVEGAQQRADGLVAEHGVGRRRTGRDQRYGWSARCPSPASGRATRRPGYVTSATHAASNVTTSVLRTNSRAIRGISYIRRISAALLPVDKCDAVPVALRGRLASE